ncbi:hypothetical protein ACM43_01415 [Bradyrhizobium sp. CCBAU 45321]|nr:hypothetical protein [Bradyrhizobium sp. CCBAU 45321]
MLFGLFAFASDNGLSILQVEDWDGPAGPSTISAARSFPEYAGCGSVFSVFWFEMRRAAVRAFLRHTAQRTNDRSGQHSAGNLDITCAMSASSQVADFECVSQLENVHAVSRGLLTAPRRSLLVSPGRSSLQMISVHARKFARCGGVSVHIAE